MRVFVTGASGFVGSAVVRELVDAGHQVVGLVRSDHSAATVEASGARVHRGDLTDLAGLRQAASGVDGVIHTAFNHDYRDFDGACATDRAVIEAFGETLAGSDRPLIVTSGLGSLKRVPGRPANEDDALDHDGPAAHRVPSETLAMSYTDRGVRVSVMRLSLSVHGEGDHGMVPALIDSARARGFVPRIGDGTNRWPAVHRLDAARLYRLALESAPAGSNLHGIAEEGVPLRDITEVIARNLNLPVTETDSADLGFVSSFLGGDFPSSGERTRKLLDWHPTHRGLVEDLEQGDYFTD
jgi:nucleoside-diphosphate-sugar epimerase